MSFAQQMNQLIRPKKKTSGDFIEMDERSEKQHDFTTHNKMSQSLNDNIRNSLTDMDQTPIQRRDRSASNEFELPPLPEMDDNKDLQEEEMELRNYKSNDGPNMFSNLAADDDDQVDFGQEIDMGLMNLKAEGSANNIFDLGFDDDNEDLARSEEVPVVNK